MKKVFTGLFLIGLLSGCQLLPDEDHEQKAIETEETIIERKEITGQLTNSDIYNINVYLSDLATSGFKSYDKENPDHDQLLNLGFWLYAYDGMDKVDSEEVDGRYYDVFPYEAFNEKINRYFDCQLEKKGNEEWLFQENKYYHPSLDMGYDLNTVIQVNRVFDNGDDSFLVEGSIYRFESFMEYNIYEQYLQPKSTWTTSMDSELIGTASVKFVYSEQLNHYVIDEYQAEYLSSAWSSIDVDDSSSYEINDDGDDELESTYTSNEEYAINQINQLSEIQAYIDLGSKVVFYTSEVVIDGMTGLQIDVYDEANLENSSLINLYFMEYETKNLYVMDIISGDYVKVN